MIGLEHLRRLATAGIYKAPIEGGVLVDTRVGVLVLGQDFSAGYSSQDGIHYYLYISESIVLRIDEPRAICAISAQAGTRMPARQPAPLLAADDRRRGRAGGRRLSPLPATGQRRLEPRDCKLPPLDYGERRRF